MEKSSSAVAVGNSGSASGGAVGLRYDRTLVLNVSSAAKIERTVERVMSLAKKRFSVSAFPREWFRHMADPCLPPEERPLVPVPSAARPEGGREPSPPSQRAAPPPFLPFTAVLVTGTAGAGKTCSVQTLASDLRCVITGSTLVSAQALSSALHRTRGGAVKTVFRTFGFNTRHVALSDRVRLGDRDGCALPPGLPPVAAQQARDLSVYWPVVADIVQHALESGRGRRDTDDFCRSNIIVIDEAGVLLRYMLHVVVFFYYFYNALADTPLWRRGAVPCLVCVGSPTQTEAIEGTRGGSMHRGLDVLSALIRDPALSEYAGVHRGGWVMFIHNKRCRDAQFGDLLTHIEFGLPLRPEHVDYLDRFVRPPALIGDSRFSLESTRLFRSHAEVKRYLTSLHDRIRVQDRRRLFQLPLYGLVHHKQFERYRALLAGRRGAFGGEEGFGDEDRVSACSGSLDDGAASVARYGDVEELTPEAWFQKNLPRLGNYSQFADHHLSEDLEIERLYDAPEGGAGDDNAEDEEDLAMAALAAAVEATEMEADRDEAEADDDAGSSLGGRPGGPRWPGSSGCRSGAAELDVDDEGRATVKTTLLTYRLHFVRDSTVGVTAKMRACVLGYAGTFDRFAEILQQDLFIERTPCEQVAHAYSLMSGLLYSAMYLFYATPLATPEVLRAFAEIDLPDLTVLDPQGRFVGFGVKRPVAEEADGARDKKPRLEDTPAARLAAARAESCDYLSAVAEEGAPLTARSVGAVSHGTSPYFAAPASSGGGGGGGGGEGVSSSSMDLDDELSDLELMCATDLYTDRFFIKYATPPLARTISFEDSARVYTVFRDIFLARYRLMQRATQGAFGRTRLMAFNRRNVARRSDGELTSRSGSFVGMLTFAYPNASYAVEGWSHDAVYGLDGDRGRVHRRVLEKGLPRLFLRDSQGFILALESNVARYVEMVNGRALPLCTLVDYGVTSRLAMTLVKSQGLSLESVAIDFGQPPPARRWRLGRGTIKLSHVYVGISRVIDPDRLFISRNPLRGPYRRNTSITQYTRRALLNKDTTLVF